MKARDRSPGLWLSSFLGHGSRPGTSTLLDALAQCLGSVHKFEVCSR